MLRYSGIFCVGYVSKFGILVWHGDIAESGVAIMIGSIGACSAFAYRYRRELYAQEFRRLVLLCIAWMFLIEAAVLLFLFADDFRSIDPAKLLVLEIFDMGVRVILIYGCMRFLGRRLIRWLVHRYQTLQNLQRPLEAEATELKSEEPSRRSV
jgi:UDP-N-acetylmuramyl pentapeptide phosphotransferase/UDP-N-acetylglucosamine-1-phosphate transferase